MEVSTFELLYKPQSPSAPAGVADVERVIQGYFLTITNLEEQAYKFNLEFVVTPIPASTPNAQYRTLTGNTLVFVDTPGVDNYSDILVDPLSSNVFKLKNNNGYITIPPNGTALIAVLPSAFGPNPLDLFPLTLPLFEVRGFVRLKLPALVTPPAFFPLAQSDEPIRIMLTAQHRGTFFTATGQISDQIQATLPVSTGRALNLLEPEPGGFVFPGGFDFSEIFESLQILQSAPQVSKPGMLAALLSELDPDGSDFAEFNASLAKAKIPFSVENRKL